jgi:hypothetical protein
LKISDVLGAEPDDSTKMVAYVHQSIAGGKFPSGVIFKGDLTEARVNRFLLSIHDKSAKLTKLSSLPTLSRRHSGSSGPKNATTSKSPSVSHAPSDKAAPTAKQAKSSKPSPSSTSKSGKKGQTLTKAQREHAEKRAEVERRRRETQRRREMEAEADGITKLSVFIF